MLYYICTKTVVRIYVDICLVFSLFNESLVMVFFIRVILDIQTQYIKTMNNTCIQ